MLREMGDVRQDRAGVRRRWFHDDYFDLFLWEDADGTVTTFQLCYDIGNRERALSWSAAHGFFHDGVDVGDVRAPFAMSPIFVADGVFPGKSVRERFAREADELAPATRSFILAKIDEFRRDTIARRRRRFRREEWQQRPQGR